MNNPLIAILVSIVVAITGAFFVSFFGSSSPIIFVEDGCDVHISKNWPSIDIQLRNRGEIEGYSSVCISSNEVIFKDLGNTSNYCTGESKYPPMSSELRYYFKSDLEFIEEDLPTNFTININADCSSKVWGYIKKPCDGIAKECEYVQEKYTNSYRLES